MIGERVRWKVGDIAHTGRLLQFVVMREMPDNQRPEQTYDVIMALVVNDVGKIEQLYADSLEASRP